VLLHGLRRPVIRVGRLAGQYAKPRSADLETRGGETLPSYRGDLVNRAEFDAAARTPDPRRMLEGHDRSAQTLNYIRALLDGGFADLEHPENWDLDFARHSPLADEYRAIVNGISGSLRLMAQVAGNPLAAGTRAEFFTSHEALHLTYEETQTTFDARHARWYLGSTHYPWVGMRTADPDGAHVEFLRGIANPVGVKVGPDFDEHRLARTLDALDPDGEPGRLTVITRFGHARVRTELPRCVAAVRATGRTVLWSCDPMHGNTESTASGHKTRRFDDILAELRDAFGIHARAGVPLGGVHIELTGDDVTECIGGARGLDESDLERAYRSHVDPRLNYEQALELAMAIAGRRAN
jgi:3-deoxy-7-phosphoheptulonate synthase